MQTVRVGDTARLIMKAGDKVLAAFAVSGDLEGDQVQIAFSPDDSTKGLSRPDSGILRTVLGY